MSDCLYCDELSGKSTNVFHRSRSGLLAARWDNYPLTPGHAEIIPVHHVERTADMSLGQLSEMLVFAREVQMVISTIDLTEVYWRMCRSPVDYTAAIFVKKALDRSRLLSPVPLGYNWGLNDGEAAGQSVRHVHLHVIPRWEGDVPEPRGGIRNMFPGDLYAGL